MPTHKDYIEELILNDEIANAIEELLKGAKASKQKDLENSVVLQSARNKRNEKDYDKGTLDRRDYLQEQAKIRVALQNLLPDYNSALPYPNGEESNGTNANGNETEKKRLQEVLGLCLDKKYTFEKELILAYDAEKKFTLQKQIEELNKQIEEYKKQINNLP